VTIPHDRSREDTALGLSDISELSGIGAKHVFYDSNTNSMSKTTKRPINANPMNASESTTLLTI
jgi:hypothetical protein